jgi:hypothetical protein
MNLKKITISKDVILIAYKLLYDLLLLLLLTFTAVLIAEGMLPGLISSKISFTKITIALILTIISIIYLGKNLNITYKQVRINKIKALPAFILLSFLLIGNSLLKFTLWENIIITLTTLLIFFLLYEIIYSSDDQE